MGSRGIDEGWVECHRALECLDEEEAKVAWLVSLGRTNARVAGDLVIKLARVKWVLRVIFIKLGVPDRHVLGEVVQDRVADLREREERLRARGADLRIVEKPRRPPRADEGTDGPRTAPGA